MSNVPDSNFDLETLFLPAWAQKSASVNQFANFNGDTEGGDRRRFRGGDQRSDRGPRRGPPGGGGGGGGRGQGQGGGRSQGGQGGFNRGPRPGGAPQGRFAEERREREPEVQLPQIETSILPEEKGVESLARQIKLTGRAYPLFDIGHLILKKPERYNVEFKVIKKADGQVAQTMVLCSLDETLWLSETDAMNHILDRHFGTFYQSEKIPSDPPKGVFTFVAQCGISGTVLGPPNYHDYQTKLRKLHTERFHNMPFEMFKARVKIVKDEAVVKKWVEDQSFKTEYICLNVPEALRLTSREEVENHFRATHLATVVQKLETYTLNGVAARALPYGPFAALARRAFEEQRRFPLRVVTALSQSFAHHGLQFFKVDKTVTHVAVSRPHFLDVNVTPVSTGVKAVLNFIDTHANTTRKKLVEALAPTPAAAKPAAPVAPVAPAVPAPVAVAPVAPVEGAEAAAASETPAAPAAPVAPVPTAPEAPALTAAQSAVIGDLHWLIHQGHVIEFANGVLETAKQPAPRPPKPAPKVQAQPKEKPAVEGAAATPAVAPEVAAVAAAEVAAPATPVVVEAAAPVAEAPVTPVAPVTPASETPAPTPTTAGEQPAAQ